MSEDLPKRKKKWTKKDYAKYFKSSDELSDYSTNKGGIVKSRYSNKKKSKSK